LKIAARVVKTTSHIHLAVAAACAEADLFRSFAGGLLPLVPLTSGRVPPFV
jgi:hypothetical protein